MRLVDDPSFTAIKACRPSDHPDSMTAADLEERAKLTRKIARLKKKYGKRSGKNVRPKKSTRSSNSRLHPAQVSWVRKNWVGNGGGLSQAEMARRLGVRPYTIHAIVHEITWKD